MKSYLIILFSLFLSTSIFAQKAKYKIFITDNKGGIYKGKFIACSDNGLVILKRGDTLTITSANISSFYLYKRGVVFPVTILATTASLIIAVASGNLSTILLLPIVGGVSSFLAYTAAKRISYQNVKTSNFLEIKKQLRKYAIEAKLL